MKAHAADLQGQIASLESTLSSSQGGLSDAAIVSALERGYVAAQRCSIWRGKVQVSLCCRTPITHRRSTL